MPVVLRNLKHGQKEANIDLSLIGQYLDVNEMQAADLLRRFSSYQEVKSPRQPRVPIDKVKLAQEFQKMLDTGKARNRSDLARQKDVSRAWISKVLKYLHGAT